MHRNVKKAEQETIDKALLIFSRLLACEILKHQRSKSRNAVLLLSKQNDQEDQRRRGKYAICSN